MLACSFYCLLDGLWGCGVERPSEVWVGGPRNQAFEKRVHQVGGPVWPGGLQPGRTHARVFPTCCLLEKNSHRWVPNFWVIRKTKLIASTAASNGAFVVPSGRLQQYVQQ